MCAIGGLLRLAGVGRPFIGSHTNPRTANLMPGRSNTSLAGAQRAIDLGAPEVGNESREALILRAKKFAAFASIPVSGR